MSDGPDVISRSRDEASSDGSAGGSLRFALLLVGGLAAFFLVLVAVSYVPA